MLMQLNIIEIVSYAIMSFLMAKAVAHWSEGYFLRRRVRAAEAKLFEIENDLLRRGPTQAHLWKVREVADGFHLARVFDSEAEPGDLPILMDRADHAIRAEIEQLHDACEQNEIAGPRWGLLFTVVGSAFALSGIAENAPANSQLNNIAFALKNTGLGLLVAIIESSALARQVIPAADRLRDISRRMLRILAQGTATAADRQDYVRTAGGRQDQREVFSAT